MSFTADIYNEILSDIFSGTGQTSPFAMRLVKFDNGIMIAFAVNIATRMRSAFLSVTSEAPKSRFPHWKGVEIETATLPAYGIDTPFIGLSQLPNSASDIFEIVVEDLRSQLEAAENTEESLSVIITVLTKWKEFCCFWVSAWIHKGWEQFRIGLAVKMKPMISTLALMQLK